MIGPIFRWILMNYGPKIIKSAIDASIKIIKESQKENKTIGDVVGNWGLKKMTESEARMILGVSTKDRGDIDYQFKKLMSLNDPTKGGSFYLQCKFMGAKEILDKIK